MFNSRRLPEHQRVVSGTTASYGTLNSGPGPVAQSFNIDPTTYHGKPGPKRPIDLLDLTSVVVSLLCLIAALNVINQTVIQLDFTGQIIAITFLLSVMNLCLTRIVQYLFLLLECQYGESILQNYEGLLRWSAFADNLSMIWRVLLLLLYLLPLILEVLYKRHIDGIATRQLPLSHRLFTPTGPPGMQGNVAGMIILANTSAPFLSETIDGIDEPPNSTAYPRIYGFSTVLLSNTSTAALDGPVPSYVTTLQQGLSSTSLLYLTADVRATIVTYNDSVNSQRHNLSYWNEYYSVQKLSSIGLLNGYWFGTLQTGSANSDEAASWDGSYVLAGTYWLPDLLDADNETLKEIMFSKSAMKFDAKRHSCDATWKVTRSSIELFSAVCKDEPLDLKYQWMQNSQLFLNNFYYFISEYLAPFATSRKDSTWLIQTYATIIALMYQAKIAGEEGFVWIQPAGPIWESWDKGDPVWNQKPNGDYFYNETYQSDASIIRQISVLRVTWGLYYILGLQPLLTVLGFCAVLVLYSVPIGREFGVLALLAGTDKTTLDLLAGAALSAETDQPIALQVRVLPPRSGYEGETGFETIEYRLHVRATVAQKACKDGRSVWNPVQLMNNMKARYRQFKALSGLGADGTIKKRTIYG